MGVTLLLILTTIALSGCSMLKDWCHNGFKVGPEYCRPAAPVSDDWIDIGDERVIPLPPEHPDWWLVLQDPVVDDLVHLAHEQNLTIRQASMRIMQARASRAIT